MVMKHVSMVFSHTPIWGQDVLKSTLRYVAHVLSNLHFKSQILVHFFSSFCVPENFFHGKGALVHLNHYTYDRT